MWQGAMYEHKGTGRRERRSKLSMGVDNNSGLEAGAWASVRHECGGDSEQQRTVDIVGCSKLWARGAREEHRADECGHDRSDECDSGGPQHGGGGCECEGSGRRERDRGVGVDVGQHGVVQGWRGSAWRSGHGGDRIWQIDEHDDAVSGRFVRQVPAPIEQCADECSRHRSDSGDCDRQAHGSRRLFWSGPDRRECRHGDDSMVISKQSWAEGWRGARTVADGGCECGAWIDRRSRLSLSSSASYDVGVVSVTSAAPTNVATTQHLASKSNASDSAHTLSLPRSERHCSDARILFFHLLQLFT